MYAAVNPSVDYVTVDAGDRKLIIAAALREELAKKLKKDLPILETQKGSELVGRRYFPPYDVYFQRAGSTELPLKAGGSDSPAWRVIAADFVTLTSGTGIVHIAPAFGEDDYNAFRQERTRFTQPEALEMFCAIRSDGTFSDEFPGIAGKFVKDADKDITRALKERGSLVLIEQYKHEYPFCWRADDDPLIQFARPAWYIRTTQVKDQAIANNRAVNWVPEHIKEGRFGDFLANNVDWALSRERYWGTALPLWIHSETGEVEAIPSLQALREKPGSNLAAVEAELKAFLAQKPGATDRRAPHRPQAVDRQSDVREARHPRPLHPRPRSHRRVVRLGLHAVRPVGLPPRPGLAREVHPGLPRRLHLRGHRPDTRLVLLAADDQHARLR